MPLSAIRRVAGSGRVTGMKKSTSDSSVDSLGGSGQIRLPAIEGREKEHGEAAAFITAGLGLGVCSRQGKRPYQEDEPSVRAYLAPSISSSSSSSARSLSPSLATSSKSETHYVALFDGHAGGKCSKFLSGALADVLAEDPSFSSNLSMALKRSFHTANEQFLKVADRMRLQDGSTGIAATIRHGKLTVANVGDCRAVLLSGGKPIQISKDQKPTDVNEQKRIASFGGSVVYCMGVARVNGVLAVSRAFGNRSLRSVIRPDAEVTTRDLQKDDDYLVIASDGLWDILRNKDVCDLCYAQGRQGPQYLAEELVNQAIARGSMDNVTCIVVSLTDYINKFVLGVSGGSLNSTGGLDNRDSPPTIAGLGKKDFSSSDTLQSLSTAPKHASSKIMTMNNLRGSPLQIDGGDSGGDHDGQSGLGSALSTTPSFHASSFSRFGVLPKNVPSVGSSGKSSHLSGIPTLFRSIAGSLATRDPSVPPNRLASLQSPIQALSRFSPYSAPK